MTRYFDSSAIIKLYVDEEHSVHVRAQLAQTDVAATSIVAYPEVRATLARLRRERRLTSAAATSAIRQFDADWPAFLSIDINEALVRDAGVLADRLGLRGFDSIHLASFGRLLQRTDDDVEFLAFDERLSAAARRL